MIDDLRDGKEKAVSESAIFVKADFGDEGELNDLFSKNAIDLVVHLAALANVPDSVINPLGYYDNNTAKTVTLLKMMQRFAVKKIVFSSTAAVYGEPNYNPIDELHVKKPVNPYGDSKLMCEQIIKDSAAAYGIQDTIFRYFCAAGATCINGEARQKESHLIPVIIDQVLGKRAIVEVFGTNFDTPDGSGVRDFIHVADIARAHVLAINSLDRYPNEEYNLGNGKGFSVLELLRITEEVLHKKVNFKLSPPRPGDPATLVATYEKAYRLMGWTPHNTIADIILSAYNWRINPRY